MLTDDIYERLSGPLQPSLDFYHSLFKGCEGGDYIQCFDHNRQILRRLTMSFSDLDCLPLGLLPGLEGHSGHQDSSGGECHKESRTPAATVCVHHDDHDLRRLGEQAGSAVRVEISGRLDKGNRDGEEDQIRELTTATMGLHNSTILKGPHILSDTHSTISAWLIIYIWYIIAFVFIQQTVSNTWKRAFMRLHAIELNWRSRRLRSPKSLKGHDDHVVTCLQFAGNRIVSGSDDNTLKVWDATTGQCLRVLIGHTGGVWSSQMSASTVISGSTDRTLRVWNSETGECTHVLYGHTSTVRCMHLHGDRVVSGSRDATLRLWDITTGACLGVFVGHVAAVRCVQFNGRLIVSGAYDYMVKVWQPGREECLHTLQGHTNRVYSLQFDGTHVVSGSLDTSIRVWDVETGECKHSLTGHQSLTSGMELRDNILVSGNADSTVKVWDITTGQCLQTLAGPSKHQSAVTCLQFNSKFVITSSDDGTVKLWDLKTGEFIRDLVCLKSGGSGGVVWRIRADQTKLVAAVGSRNGTEETQLLVLDFDAEEPPMSGLIENMSDDCSSATQTASEPGPSGISAIGQLAQQQASWEF
ncbi:F-box/WD repeat-containing protein 7-like [Varroa destructor]|uniref:Uncharacterized protein n=1 Tax=Varroa destructor TaxID=109461 RepID=A0A7M7JAX3_VARDE|nr:F-box/WD repeat-containing protein 7-like [Varroa destructor]